MLIFADGDFTGWFGPTVWLLTLAPYAGLLVAIVVIGILIRLMRRRYIPWLLGRKRPRGEPEQVFYRRRNH